MGNDKGKNLLPDGKKGDIWVWRCGSVKLATLRNVSAQQPQARNSFILRCGC